jgi:hypothetical protein
MTAMLMVTTYPHHVLVLMRRVVFIDLLLINTDLFWLLQRIFDAQQTEQEQEHHGPSRKVSSFFKDM